MAFEMYMAIFWFLIGTFVVIPLILPFFWRYLENDPDNPHKFLAIFTRAEPYQVKVKMRGGNPVGVIRGSDMNGKPMPPQRADAANLIWWLYQRYVYLFGVHVIGIPGLQVLHTYALPRRRKIRSEREGEHPHYIPVHPDDSGYRSDHVRNSYFTWYFQFSGAEIGSIPFTILGSLQVRILPERELDALFKTNAWNELLDEVLTSVTRAVVRSSTTIDEIIGTVAQDIWEDERKVDEGAYTIVQNRIFEQIEGFEIEGETIEKAVGLDVMSVQIVDFVPELSDEEARELRAAALRRQMARAEALAGQGEAEYQRRLLEAAEAHGDHGTESIWAKAMIDSSKEGKLEALLTALLSNMTRR